MNRYIFRTVLFSLILAPQILYGQTQPNKYIEVSVGEDHICALTKNQMVDCTTQTFATRYDAPYDVPALKAIAAGQQHTCGISLEGAAVCWGGIYDQWRPNGGGYLDPVRNGNHFGELNIPNITQPLQSIAAGDNHTCAIDETGKVWCWGLNLSGQSDPPSGGRGANDAGYIKVDGANTYSCGIQTDGDISCWTNSTHLGDMSLIRGPFTDLDLSNSNACGLKQNGDIECWASNMQPPANGPYTDLAVRDFGICGLDQFDKLDCVFRPNVDPAKLDYPSDTQFSSIESGISFISQSSICGVTKDEDIECLGTDLSLLPPGKASKQKSEIEVSTIHLTLQARAYATGFVELFWNGYPGSNPTISFEIYRNDELLITVPESYSRVDSSEGAEGVNTYRIRAIDAYGSVGPFSKDIVVDSDRLIVSSGNALEGQSVQPSTNDITSLDVRAIGEINYLTWRGTPAGQNGVKGYQISINNEVVLFTTDMLYIDSNDYLQSCRVFTVAAISDEDEILNFKTTTVVRESYPRYTGSCRVF